jgi:CDP-4-dehydro-6-deoxyglucose reductase/3-phenylpropionate/trans-cinnamate dioxygenase ferredoxin reductase subunit
VSIVQLRYPIGTRAKFRAGQYLKVLLEDGDSRNYSLANEPTHNDGAELHIRHIAGGRFSEHIVPDLALGDQLNVETPFGQFCLNDGAETAVIMLATGTGFAPLKSIIQNQIRQRGTRPITLYWGARRRCDLYAFDLATTWAEQCPWFSFVPVLSRPDHAWTGRTGYVQHAAREDHPDLRGFEIYACGNPVMTAAARRELPSRHV